MTIETIFLGSAVAKARAINLIDQAPINGALKVVITDTKGRSAQQNALYWKWCTEVSRAGVGGEHEDNKTGVHVVSKRRFGAPIIRRDTPDEWEFIAALEREFRDNPAALYHIADRYITTTDFKIPQMAEYMTDFQRYYGDLGVRLTLPDDGLLDFAESYDR